MPLLTPLTSYGHEQELPAVNPGSPNAGRSQSHHPRIMFSPALTRYFVELRGQQVRIEGGHISD
jgi:hypothetical protein